MKPKRIFATNGLFFNLFYIIKISVSEMKPLVILFDIDPQLILNDFDGFFLHIANLFCNNPTGLSILLHCGFSADKFEHLAVCYDGYKCCSIKFFLSVDNNVFLVKTPRILQSVMF